MNNNNVIVFLVGKTRVEARVEEHWVEFNFYFASGNWFRKFVSKAGYSGPDEIPEVARDILAKSWVEYKKLAR